MTVTTAYSALTFNCNGSVTAFSITWPFFLSSDLVVAHITSAGVETALVLTTDYTVTGGRDATTGLPAVGTLTTVATYAAGVTLRVERSTPRTQSTSFTTAGAFPAKTVEAAFDRVHMIAEEGGSGGQDGVTGDTMQLNSAGAQDYWDGEGSPVRLPFVEFSEASAPDTPSSGYGRLYVKTDGSLNFKDDAGTESDLTSYAADAEASATAAASSASAASTSASAASTSASAASTSASAASTSASNASTSATNASNSASAASTSETNAATSASAAAAAAGFSFTYSTTTTMADPGSGVVRFNNATLASVTAVAIDDLSADAGTPDVSAWIGTFDNSTNSTKGTLRFRKKSAPQNFVDYTVTGLTDNSGWTELAVTHAASNGSLSNSDTLLMAFYATGDVGPAGPGAGDVTGPASSVASEIALFDGTTGKLLKSATTTGIIKATSGVIAAAVSGTDYAPATSGTSILKGNGAGGFSSASGGVDYANASHIHTQSQITGLTTADSPQFTGINIGHASDTTLTRTSAGLLAVEGNNIHSRGTVGFVSVKEYGATGDGSTDDTSAINTAAAAAAAAGKALYVPSGTYIVNAPIVMWNDGVIFGDGPKQSILKAKASTNVGAIISGSSYDGFQIRGIQLNGNDTNSATTSGFYCAGSNKFHVDNLYIYDCSNYGMDIDGPDSSYTFGMEASITNCCIEKVGYHGINFIGPHDSYFSNIIIIDASQDSNAGFSGLYVGASTNGRFVNVHCWHRSGVTNRVAYAVDCNGSGNEFIGCHFEGAATSAAHINSSGNCFHACKFYANLSGGIHIRLRAPFNMISGQIEAPIAGNAIGIAYGIGSGDNCSSNFVELVAMAQLAGIIDYTYDDGNNVTNIAGFNASGTNVVGTAGSNSLYRIRISGGTSTTLTN